MNRYNILTDPLPRTVLVNGVEYQINSDFRISVKFEMLMRDKSVPDQVKVMRMLELYFPVLPPDLNESVKSVLWFYNCGMEHADEPEEDKKQKRYSSGNKKNSIPYSFKQDAPYIYAAFREQYGINLQSIPENELHWWEFLSMFKSLRDDTKIGQIMYYRTVSVSGMPNNKRKAINDLKKIYEIKDDSDIGAKVTLAHRNAKMQEYVKKRIMETRSQDI